MKKTLGGNHPAPPRDHPSGVSSCPQHHEKQAEHWHSSYSQHHEKQAEVMAVEGAKGRPIRVAYRSLFPSCELHVSTFLRQNGNEPSSLQHSTAQRTVAAECRDLSPHGDASCSTQLIEPQRLWSGGGKPPRPSPRDRKGHTGERRGKT